MEDNSGAGYFTQSPMMTWESFLDPNIPPLDLDSNFGLNEAGLPSSLNDNGVNNWLQDANAGADQLDLTTRHGHTRALSTSAIPPAINIDFAPPSRTQNHDQVNGAVPSWSDDWYQSPSLMPLDMRRRPRSPSPARSVGSVGRMRSSSTGSMRSDYILDPSDSQRIGARVQKHPATFQCSLCPKRFTRAYNLRSHLRTHTDERSFVCTVCGKAFARQQDRKRHEGLHAGEKKFVCKGNLANGSLWGCGRRFARADALFRHVRSEAGQVCIRPLFDEEAAIKQSTWMAEQQEECTLTNDIPGIPTSDSGAQKFVLPAALLAQYPALAGVEPDNVPAYNPSASPLSRSSSFGASSFGSTGPGYDGNGFTGFGDEHSVSRQVSDASLHSAHSATSFSSQRGSRILGGYECNQCGAAFDVPSELRHHERKHLSKEQRPHACEHCGERFLYPKDVQRHTKRRHPDAQSISFLEAIQQAVAVDGQDVNLDPLLQHMQVLGEGFSPGHSPRIMPQPLMALPHFDLNSGAQQGRSMQDHSMLSLDTDAIPTLTHAGPHASSGSERGNPHLESAANQPNEPSLPRSKSTEILHLKQALEAAKHDARLWREERNFYAELLQDSIPHTDLNLALRFLHKEEVVSPVRRARGWLGGIWGLFRTRRNTEHESESRATASRAVMALAEQLERMDVASDGSGGGRRKSSSREGSRASSPIRAKWKKFEGWVAGSQ